MFHDFEICSTSTINQETIAQFGEHSCLNQNTRIVSMAIFSSAPNYSAVWNSPCKLKRAVCCFKVKPLPTDRLLDLLESLQGSTSSITDLINRGNFNLAVQMTYSILSVVEETDIAATGKRKACFFFISVNPIIYRESFSLANFPSLF